MDNSSSERSPSYTDSSPGSFGQMKFWESDVSNTTSHRRKPTYPLFGLDHVKEIEGLVEDKDVASKAVTFVVNGTRKGVVPLCADVACLMRVKQRLEQTVEKQRREIEHLRSLHNSRASIRTSRSTSPTPPSVESDETNLQKITSDQCSLCLRCSPPSTKCSPSPSTYASSVHLSQTLEQSPSSVQSKEDSWQVEGSNTDILGDHQHVIRAEVHSMPINTAEVTAKKKTNHVTNDTRLLEGDVNADDSSEDSSDSVTVVEPHPVQRETFQSEYRIQSRLEADLESARKEIIKLRSQLQASPAKELNASKSEVACEMDIIDETSTSFGSDSSSVCLPHIQPNSQSSVVLVRQTTMGSSHSSNCCCTKCTGYKEEERIDKQEDCSSSMTEISALEHHSNHCHGHSVPVQLNDRVVIRGGRIGHIRYIGPLNHGNSNTKSTTYLGLQLDEPHGHHDGIHNGKRYFWCHRNHGIFVPIQDVLSVIKSKTSRPQTVKSSRKSSIDHSKLSAFKREKSGTRNRVAPALLPTPPTTAKPKKEFLSGT
ncbi:centrosome-associated protein 350-like isoform X2 [Anneissia japonica]|uniref:centrosome-associated protein 350-like isoform X2 n=1 Tax=Anneissia japonica TaxID=1529436 RepID=UPI001425B875|nr:centrosome-associated protein 350-like isoform X2 [Anneissia japonica]